LFLEGLQGCPRVGGNWLGDSVERMEGPGRLRGVWGGAFPLAGLAFASRG
jgi:hypothetical protein